MVEWMYIYPTKIRHFYILQEECLWVDKKRLVTMELLLLMISVYYKTMIPTLITGFSGYETNESRPLVLLVVLMMIMTMFTTE
jgi:hypothetical protein